MTVTMTMMTIIRMFLVMINDVDKVLVATVVVLGDDSKHALNEEELGLFICLQRISSHSNSKGLSIVSCSKVVTYLQRMKLKKLYSKV